MLVLAPKQRRNREQDKLSASSHVRSPQILKDVGDKISKYLVGQMVSTIHTAMESASRSWVDLGDHLEQLLAPNNPEELLLDDEEFSQSQKCFWVINTIDLIDPMIRDAIQQWEWYRSRRKLDCLPESDLIIHVAEAGFRDEEEEKVALFTEQEKMEYVARGRDEMQRMVGEIEGIKHSLLNSQRRFQSIRDRATSMRDGVSIDHPNYVIRYTTIDNTIALQSRQRQGSERNQNTWRKCQASDLCDYILPPSHILHGKPITLLPLKAICYKGTFFTWHKRR